MIKQITQYPTVPSQAFDGIVRHYDIALLDLLQNLKDTMTEHHLDGLAAYQIGSSQNVIVIKQEEGFLEIINPIIITKEGSLTPIESTAYYPKLTATTKRYQKIKLMYEDRTGKQLFLTAEDALAILIQRKTDYLLGANFRVRMDEEEKAHFDAKLEGNLSNSDAESCPSTEPKIIKNILLFLSISLIIGTIGVVLGLFVSDDITSLLSQGENYLMLCILIGIVVYFLVAHYEGKKYSNCTSCQIGNIVGTTFIQAIRLGLLALANYFIF
jgi:peptide deformylase